MDRIKVNEERSLSSLSGCYDRVSIGTLIAELQELQEQGWEKVETDKYNDYGDDVFTIRVTKSRLENDEEFARRRRIFEANEQHEREHYLLLKAKFESGAS